MTVGDGLLDITSKLSPWKKRIGKLGFIKIKILYFAKDTGELKDKAQPGENIHETHI